ncbi:TonB-dependent receptor plug domain-containing protein [Pedosphaera parvula]|uniref:TonB-dependent receptor plug n=1 Tax=Pedosphaera parvula (strain Ellin514) TaxID=320771 RepID=B9XIB6_PEDPL|nr:TonB-dependent receptor [Pedosphaera parvula]EEF60377.1 TonB-dependent receptor plug [Pedosphaera parvula Ellin514]
MKGLEASRKNARRILFAWQVGFLGRTICISCLRAACVSTTAALLLMVTATHVQAEEVKPAKLDLTEMSIDELMKIPVTTVSRKAEEFSKSPAAIYVLTQDDIRRSGATSIPEVLRLVPGLDVAQVDSQQWAISARGFNDVFANKLLVLQDGRSVYTPLFSGVFWDVQDTILEDIDRIEVVRGPGGTLWGANAVNGVINIITKSAKDTQGVLITGGGGTYEHAFGGFRYGDKVGEDLYLRVYGKYFDRDESVRPNGSDIPDSWQMGRGGFRMDWDKWEKTGNLLTVQGDIYEGWLDQEFGTFNPFNPPTYSSLVQDEERVSGGNLLGRWSHQFSDSSDLKIQTYYDRTERDTAIFRESRDTFDLDLQHHFTLGDRNDFVWGAGYRLDMDRIGNTPSVSLFPSSETTHLFSTFVQDEITLVEKRLRLTLGTKLEHNDFTGFEYQPSGRLLWTPHEKHTFWASISRAVRTPSRAEEDVRLSSVIAPGVVNTIYGNNHFLAEDLLAYEFGYRVQPSSRVSFDLAMFYNVYDQLRSVEFGFSPTQPVIPPPPPPGFFIPTFVANELYGDTYGFELASTIQLADWWRLKPSYTFLEMQLKQRAGSTDISSIGDMGKSPEQQFSVTSAMDFPHGLSLDCAFRYVDQLPTLNISSYVALDVRLGWRATKNLEMAIVGQNLLSAQHAEFAPTFIQTPRAEVQHGVYGKVTVRF